MMKKIGKDDILMLPFCCFCLHVYEGYDGGSSDSECESPTLDEQECQSPLMPDFWLIVKIHQDRVKVYSHSRSDKPQEMLWTSLVIPAIFSLWPIFIKHPRVWCNFWLAHISQSDTFLIVLLAWEVKELYHVTWKSSCMINFETSFIISVSMFSKIVMLFTF